MKALSDLYSLIARVSELELADFTSLLTQAASNVDPEQTTIAQLAAIVSRWLPSLLHGKAGMPLRGAQCGYGNC